MNSGLQKLVLLLLILQLDEHFKVLWGIKTIVEAMLEERGVVIITTDTMHTTSTSAVFNWIL